jgi:phosphoglycolate phosphatase-like HAD superfamily hydrolase
MNKRFQEYKTVIFDCDGVVLDSNRVKSDAFYNSVLAYGEEPAKALLEFHQENGGVSRYKKFDHFFESIFPLGDAEQERVHALQLYSQYVWEGLFKCNLEPSLEELRQKSPDSKWMIVSGGDQAELREVFLERDIKKYFDGGIFGSPDTKDEILSREVESGNIEFPALFIGDSKYDYMAARAVSLDFIFVHQWTEVANWSWWVNEQKIKSVYSLRELLC